MKYESFQLSDLCIKGEGNLHVVVLNKRTGQVFRFPKEVRKDIESADNCNVENIDLNTNKLFKITVYYKKYNVFQRFWGKDYLPKMESQRVCLFPGPIIELIAVYLESHRQESRKSKSLVTKTSYIEIQQDLTKFPIEYDYFTNGITYCIELKPKFGILFQPANKKLLDCRNKMGRFCIAQMKKPEDKKTNYCPCDMFSGNPHRISRAIKALIQNPQEKLRIFQDGQILNFIDKRLICFLMDHLFQQSHIDEEEALEKFCDLIFQALCVDVSDKRNLLKLPFRISTNCQAHSWSEQRDTDNVTEVLQIYSGSVLGRLILTSCLVDKRTEEMNELYDKLQRFLEENAIQTCQSADQLFPTIISNDETLCGSDERKRTENIFDLWNEHLLPLDLPDDIIEIVRILKKYLVCLTVRDCSIMIKFKKGFPDKLWSAKQSNAAILRQMNGSVIFTKSDVIDISIKPISKIKSNFEYEQELLKLFK